MGACDITSTPVTLWDLGQAQTPLCVRRRSALRTHPGSSCCDTPIVHQSEQTGIPAAGQNHGDIKSITCFKEFIVFISENKSKKLNKIRISSQEMVIGDRICVNY